MKPLVEKMLKSGLVDKHTAEIMERWGQLPDGSADLVPKENLKNATKEQLSKLVEEIAEEVEVEDRIRETTLDLNAIRWPMPVSFIIKQTNGFDSVVARNLSAVIDRMGRLFFRAPDVRQEWFVPGYFLELNVPFSERPVRKEVLEVTPLFVGEQTVAIQVSVR